MKKLVFDWHIWVIMLFALIACIGIFSEPADNTDNWFFVFVTSKAVGFASAYITYRLIVRWFGEPGDDSDVMI